MKRDIQHPFKIGVGPEGSEDLKARVIEGSLTPDSLRLIHPQTRDLILKVSLKGCLYCYDVDATIVPREESWYSTEPG